MSVKAMRGVVMQVGRWGNSLAVRLPAAVVELLQLREGDEIEVEIAGDRALAVRRDDVCRRAVERLAQFGWTLPPGFRFSRGDANER